MSGGSVGWGKGRFRISLSICRFNLRWLSMVCWRRCCFLQLQPGLVSIRPELAFVRNIYMLADLGDSVASALPKRFRNRGICERALVACSLCEAHRNLAPTSIPTVLWAIQCNAAAGVWDELQAKPDALFVFGDSYADTGNRNKSDPLTSQPWQYPYGITWGSGRFSDGRVSTDYFGT